VSAASPSPQHGKRAEAADTTPAAAQAQPAADAAKPAPQPQQPLHVARQHETTQASAPAAPAAPARAGQLAPRSIDEVAHAVVRIARRDGAPQARINLHPAELGGVEVRLRYHAGGVSAQLSADTAQGGQALQQAAGELRRSLEAQGVAVHGLDVTVTTDADRMPQRERQPEQGTRSRRQAVEAIDEQEIPIEPTSLPLAAGSVNVLA
jgi:flagellar hook-length control protein FliK